MGREGARVPPMPHDYMAAAAAAAAAALPCIVGQKPSHAAATYLSTHVTGSYCVQVS